MNAGIAGVGAELDAQADRRPWRRRYAKMRHRAENLLTLRLQGVDPQVERRAACHRDSLDGAVVAENLTVESLRRFKDDATEVREGFECGISLGNYNDINVDDVIETFELREKPRS